MSYIIPSIYYEHGLPLQEGDYMYNALSTAQTIRVSKYIRVRGLLMKQLICETYKLAH